MTDILFLLGDSGQRRLYRFAKWLLPLRALESHYLA